MDTAPTMPPHIPAQCTPLFSPVPNSETITSHK
jgi:hypothetical protein